jgi:hypothetical protein
MTKQEIKIAKLAAQMEKMLARVERNKWVHYAVQDAYENLREKCEKAGMRFDYEWGDLMS